jgi:hypothetical protein
MFQICVIKENAFSDFEKSLWIEKQKVIDLITFKETNDLNVAIGEVFNPDFKNDKLNLNTFDVFYTRTSTYQLVVGYEGNENYIGSILNYKRKTVTGPVILIKIKIINEGEKLQYADDNFTQDDFMRILGDMYSHKGFHINSELKLSEIMYDNKYNILSNDNNFALTSIKNTKDITIMGVPFKIWYEEGNSTNPLLKNIGYFIDKNVSNVYITSIIYPEKKCVSFDDIFIKHFIDLISLFPDEGELKNIEIGYSLNNKEVRSENIFILFEDFYWYVKRS